MIQRRTPPTEIALHGNDHDHLMDGTSCAWKVYLDLQPGMLAVDLACGYGARSLSLSSHGVNCIAIETDTDKAHAASQRLSHADPAASHRPHQVLVVQRLDQLPLSSGIADIVLLPFLPRWPAPSPFPRDPARSLPSGSALEEVRRILRGSGQLLVHSANSWSSLHPAWPNAFKASLSQRASKALPSAWQPSPLTHRHIARRLRASVTAQLAASRDRYGNLANLSPLSIVPPRWSSAAIKRHLRVGSLLAPELITIASGSGRHNHALIDHVLEHVGTLAELRSSGLNLRRVQHHLSRKDKLILTIPADTRRVIVRIALSEAAKDTQKSAAQVLETLKAQSEGPHWFPRQLPSGEVNGVYHCTEFAVRGRPLRQDPMVSTERGLDVASELLERMNPRLEQSPLVAFTGTVYDGLITRPARLLADITGEHEPLTELTDALAHHLTHKNVRMGVTHGDFSVSNIFIDPDGKANLIDWEDSHLRALPILDSIAFWHSRRRLLDHQEGFERPTSAPFISPPFRTHAEERFMADQFSRCLDTPIALDALACLRWLITVSSMCRFSFMLAPAHQRTYISEPLRHFHQRLRVP